MAQPTRRSSGHTAEDAQRGLSQPRPSGASPGSRKPVAHIGAAGSQSVGIIIGMRGGRWGGPARERRRLDLARDVGAAQ